MRTDAVDFCLRISLAHASLNLKLDDELGTLHGLSLADFLLLRLLARAEGGRLTVADLVRPMGVRHSAVMRQLIALEKTGRVQRESADDGTRTVVLRPGGRRLLNEAMSTAEEVCAHAVRALPADAVPTVASAMARLSEAEALAL